MIQKPPSSTPLVTKDGRLMPGWAPFFDAVSRQASNSLDNTTVHNDLDGREATDAHPASAIDVAGVPLDSTLTTMQATDVSNASAAASAQATATAAATSAASANTQVQALATGVEAISTHVNDLENRVTVLENQEPDLSYLEQIGFNIAPTSTISAEGQLQWNAQDHTLDIGLANGSVLQVGQEENTWVYNNSGVSIPDGSAVYFSGSQGQRVTISMASASTSTGDDTIAVTTATIEDGAYGYVTRAGLVRGIDTNAYNEGDKLYLGTTPGTIVNVAPAKPNHQVVIGYCIKKAGLNDGMLMVAISKKPDLKELCDVDLTGATQGAVPMLGASGIYNAYNFKSLWDADKDPTGFENNQNISVAYNGTNRTITLTTTDSQLYYWWKGTRIALGTTTWTSSAHTNSAGSWYLYSTDGATFTWSNTLWNFYDIQVATVRYASSTKYIAMKETHGLADWNFHRTAHWGIGTQRNGSTPQGGTIGGYTIGSTVAADRRPSATTVDLLDEDLVVNVPALTDGGPYSHLQLASSTTTDYILNTELEIVHMSGTTAQYQSPTTAAWSNIGNNNYANCYLIAIPATTETVGQYGRWLWLQPQASYANLALARAESFSTLNKADLLNLFAEFLPVAKVTIKAVATNFSIEYVEQLYGSRASASGVVSPAATTASAVSFTPTGNIAATDVQSAIAELDTEKVAANAAIVAATKTKITYDTKGLVTAGDVLAASDIPAHTNATGATIGQATASLYGHAKATGTTPTTAGVAAVGTDDGLYARGDHTHGAQTSVTGNAGTATKLATPRAINGVNFDGSAAITITAAPNAHASTHAGAGSDAITSLGAHTVDGDITLSGTPRKILASAGTLAGSWGTGTDGTYNIFSVNSGTTFRTYADLTSYDVRGVYKQSTTDRVIIDPLQAGTGAIKIDGNAVVITTDSRLSDARTPLSHTHGNISNGGLIGVTANLPIITGTGGILQAGSFGTAANTFCQGNDSRLSDARTPTAHVLDSATHTISGKTAGQVLLATGATTYAFTAISGDGGIAGTGVLTNAKINITEHSANNVEYPIVWDNSSRELYHTAAKMTFNPSTGTASATLFKEGGTLLSSKYRAELEPVSGTWFQGTPKITISGVMDIGAYLDFHSTNAGTSDFDVRIGVISTSSDSLTCTGHIIPSTTDSVDIGSATKVWANVRTTNLICTSSNATSHYSGSYGQWTDWAGNSGSNNYMAAYGTVSPGAYNPSILVKYDGTAVYLNSTNSVYLSYSSGTALYNRLIANSGAVDIYADNSATAAKRATFVSTGGILYGGVANGTGYERIAWNDTTTKLSAGTSTTSVQRITATGSTNTLYSTDGSSAIVQTGNATLAFFGATLASKQTFAALMVNQSTGTITTTIPDWGTAYAQGTARNITRSLGDRIEKMETAMRAYGLI